MSLPRVLSILGLAAIFFIPLAYSQPRGATLDDVRGHQFEQLDTDGDTYISGDEFRAWYLEKLDANFRRMDQDRDERLSEDEFIYRGKPSNGDDVVRDAGTIKRPVE